MKRSRECSSSSGLLILLAFLPQSHGTEHENDLCMDDAHCFNGGKCQEAHSEIPHRHCHCADGFSGPTCDRFCPLQCQNGGICHVAPTGGAEGLLHQGVNYDPEDYTCKCFGHYTGASCEIPYRQCGKSENCYNGGRCMAGDDDLKHHCKCSNGYIGASCETKSQLIEVSDTATQITLMVMVVVLAVALVLLLKRKRKKNIPDFVLVQQEAMKKQLKQMPHSSYNDEPLQVHVGPFGNESKLNAII
jgi:hypothetical protein